MTRGADIKTPPPAALPEDMFREAVELAARVNRRVTDSDVLRGAAVEPARASEPKR